jgi:hypothetical protein
MIARKQSLCAQQIYRNAIEAFFLLTRLFLFDTILVELCLVPLGLFDREFPDVYCTDKDFSYMNLRENNGAASSGATILPKKLPVHVAEAFQQTLQHQQIENGLKWVVDNISEDKNALYLANTFIERYQEQVFHRRQEALQNFMPTFNAAIFARCLAVLPRFRMEMAQKGFNYTFLETWLKKKLLAAVLGITVNDIDRKVFLSGRTPPQFLNEELARLLPLTCLREMRY